MPTPKVAIVYLSYNARPYLDGVVASLENQAYPKENLKLYIVDNPGTDGSADFIRDQVVPKSGQSLPEIEFIENKTNTGFAQGNNVAIKKALAAGFDYVYLLNVDAKLHSRALEEAVQVAEVDDKVGSVQSLMLLWQNPDQVNSTGNSVHYLGFGFARDYLRETDEIDYPSGSEIAFASGAAVLYRARVLEQVGLLDDFLWMYHEDLDLGWRIRLAGYKNVLATRSIIYHHYEFSRSIGKWFWMERNRYIVHLAHLKLATLIAIAPAWLLMEFIVIGGSIKNRFFGRKVLSLFDLLRPRTIRHILAKRTISQDLRQVSDKEILKLFAGNVEHQETDDWIVSNLINPFFNGYFRVVKKFVRW